MNLQEKIRNDLKGAMKSKDEARTSALRVLIGEFGRQASKELSDKEVQGIIRKLVKSEAEILEKSGRDSSDYQVTLESYLPRQPTEAEVRAWISENINIEEYGNKIQAMKPILANFAGTVDGNLVRKILESL